MGLFDGVTKKFAARLVARLNEYATALEEQAPRNVPGNPNYPAVLALRLVAKSITDIVESE